MHPFDCVNYLLFRLSSDLLERRGCNIVSLNPSQLSAPSVIPFPVSATSRVQYLHIPYPSPNFCVVREYLRYLPLHTLRLSASESLTFYLCFTLAGLFFSVFFFSSP